MKKLVIILVLTAFCMASVSPAYAGRYSGYRHYHSSGWGWGIFGLGILAGTAVTSLLYAPPANAVVVEPAYPVVVQPTPVIVQRPTVIVHTPTAASGRVSVTAPILNVRSGPGLSFAVIDRAYQGDFLTVKGGAPQWLYVQLPTGNLGWVMTEFTSQTVLQPSG